MPYPIFIKNPSPHTGKDKIIIEKTAHNTVLPDIIRLIINQPVIFRDISWNQAGLSPALLCSISCLDIFVHFLGSRHGNHQIIQHGTCSRR